MDRYPDVEVVEAGDLNGDGFGDVVISNRHQDYIAVLWCGSNRGPVVTRESLQSSEDFYVEPERPCCDFEHPLKDNDDVVLYRFESVGDINGDGLSDVQFRVEDPFHQSSNCCKFARLNWANDKSFIEPLAERHFQIEPDFDFNGDGFQDAIVVERFADPVLVFGPDLTNHATRPAVLGDTNADRQVDFRDFSWLATRFGEEHGLPPEATVDEYFANADFNQDGKTSFADFLVMAHQFGCDARPNVDECELVDESI